MADPSSSPDWSLVQSFLAVAETGSLSAAARQLARSQPTLGRHIRTLELELGTELFHRHARGLNLTDTGIEMLPQAQKMREAIGGFTLTAAGHAQAVRGTVRITASVFISHLILPPIIASLRVTEPEIQIVLIPSDETENLLFREADIAMRMYRPSQLDMITLHVGNLDLGVFAARTYLERKGYPATLSDLLQHDLIGYDRNDLILRHMRDLGWQATEDMFAVRCDNQATYWSLLRAGCGVGFGQRGIEQDDPLVEELALPLDVPPLSIWLTAHEAVRQTPRVQRVWDHLATHMRAHCLKARQPQVRDIDAAARPG